MTSPATDLDAAERRALSRPKAQPAALAIVGYAAGFLVGAALLVAAWSKAADPAGFAAQLVRDGMAPAWGGMALAVAVIALEWGLGVALVVGWRTRAVLALGSLLMAAFLGLALFELVFPPEDPSSCGCFGNFVQQDPVQHATTNGVLFALSLLAWLGRSTGTRRWKAVASIAATLFGFVFALAAPTLPIDGWPGVTMLAPGTSLDDLPIVDALPEAASGTWLVLVLDRADPETQAAIPRINDELALGGGPTQVVGLAEDNAELATEFLFAAGPAFEIHGVSWGMLKPLYRQLPRAFVMRDGIVQRVWNGLPSDADLAALAEGRIP